MKKTKRIKKVFGTSSHVFHLWANQSQTDARQAGSKGRFGGYYGSRAYFQGKSCYSYGSHYEVGRIVTYKGIQIGLINNAGYPSTTGEHVREAYNALDGLMPRILIDGSDSFNNVRQALVTWQGKLVDALFDHFNQRSFWSGWERSWYLPSDLKEFNNTCRTLKHPELFLEVPNNLIQLAKDHVKKCLAREEKLKGPEFQAKREAAKAKRAELELKKHENEVVAWRAFGPTTAFIRSLRPQILRVMTDINTGNQWVQSSGGAEVPLIEAQNLLMLINSRRVKKGDTVGSFAFDSVNKDGLVKIGCHYIDIAEAEKVLSTESKLKLVKG